MTATDAPTLVKVADVDWAGVDAAFCCLPHATTQEILASLPRHIKVVDLSADFRLKDTAVYAEWCAPEPPRLAAHALGPSQPTWWQSAVQEWRQTSVICNTPCSY